MNVFKRMNIQHPRIFIFRAILHCIFWTLVFVVSYHEDITYTAGDQNVKITTEEEGVAAVINAGGESFLMSIVYFMLMVALFYINYFHLIPGYLAKKKYGRYILLALVLLLGFTGLRMSMENIWEGETMVLIVFTLVYGVGYFLLLLTSSVFRFAEDWFQHLRVKKELEKQNLKSEIAYLRSQMNPHFLFNTLNNIYSLAYKKSDKTAPAILKISNMMRYMLYETKGKKVPLKKELDVIRDYIELEKLRLKEGAVINFEVEGTTHENSIEPLLLIPFVENAFKHSDISTLRHPLNFEINVNNGSLYFSSENHVSDHLQKDEMGGVGLENVKRRLELSYPGNHELKVREKDNRFTVELKINLK